MTRAIKCWNDDDSKYITISDRGPQIEFEITDKNNIITLSMCIDRDDIMKLAKLLEQI